MICPVCGHMGNLPGADWCEKCQFELAAVDRPAPSDRVEQSLLTEPVAVLNPRAAVTVSDSDDLRTAIKTMTTTKVGAVLVTDKSGVLTGILTERDIVTKVGSVASFDGEPVSRFMTEKPETVTPADPLVFALGKMAGGNYRHLPVISDGKPVGVISVRDLLRHIVDLCRETG